MADNINSINTGKYNIGDEIPSNVITFKDEIYFECTIPYKTIYSGRYSECVDSDKNIYAITYVSSKYYICKISKDGEYIGSCQVKENARNIFYKDGYIYVFIFATVTLQKINCIDLSIEELKLSKKVYYVGMSDNGFYLGCEMGYVQLVDFTLNIIWEQRIINGSDPIDELFYTSDYLFVVSSSNYIYRLNVDTGVTLYQSPPNLFLNKTLQTFICDDKGIIYYLSDATAGKFIIACDGNTSNFTTIHLNNTNFITVIWYSNFIDKQGYLYWGDRYGHKKLDTKTLTLMYDKELGPRDNTTICVDSNGVVYTSVSNKVIKYQQKSIINY